MHVGKQVVCWWSTTPNVVGSLRRCLFLADCEIGSWRDQEAVGGAFGGGWRMEGLLQQRALSQMRVQLAPSAFFAHLRNFLSCCVFSTAWSIIAFFGVYFSVFAQHLNAKVAPTFLQTGEKQAFFFVVSWGGEPFNGNGPRPVPLSKESEQFQSIDSNVIHISVPSLSFCCQLSVSLVSLRLSLPLFSFSFFFLAMRQETSTYRPCLERTSCTACCPRKKKKILKINCMGNVVHEGNQPFNFAIMRYSVTEQAC